VQQIRSLLMDLGDRAADLRFLARDGPGQFTASFGTVLTAAGIEAVKILWGSETRFGCLVGSQAAT